jgi:WD40 repeat protein/serine/threonine protein kinase
MNANKAREIFVELVANVPAEQWEARLLELAGDDDEVRHRVELLLAAHRQGGSFLASPAAPLGITADDPITERPGTVIGPYKLLEQIGEGGFGVVFMAEQTQPVRRKVALKILKPGMDTRQVVARFEAERQALAIMDHPNIAKVLDGGATASGRPFFVMELVKGVPITDFCDQNHLTPQQRLELFVPVCHAVQHAHQKGIIHRDLKPSNVIVTVHDTTPVPRIIDFGVAKALGQELTDKTLFTGFAQLIGTPLYMSPEQAGQSGLDIDTRSDIYSLGVLLYELLTGTTPFTKERFKQATYDEIRRIIREEEPPKPSTRLSELGRSGERSRTNAADPAGLSGPTSSLASVSAVRQTEPTKLTKLVRGELDWVVMKALEKDRNRRYETANALASDLRKYLADEPVQACPPSAVYRFRKFARRNKSALAMAALIASALVMAVVGLAVSNWLVARERDQKVQALSEREKSLASESAALALADVSAAEAEANLYVARMNLAQIDLENGNVGRILDVLGSYRHPTPGKRDLRGWEWYYQDRLCNSDLRTLKGHTGAVHSLGFSLDGSRLASASGDTVKVWDLTRDRELGTVKRQQVRWQVASGERLTDTSVTLDVDGSRLAAGSSDGTLEIWDAVSGRKLVGLKGHPGRVVSVAFSPDGSQLASGGVDGMVKVWDAAGGQELRTLKGHGRAVWALAFNPSGKLLASGSGDRTIRLWDVAKGQELRTLKGHAGEVTTVAFGPDGAMLSSGSEDGTVKIWDTAKGQELRTFKLTWGMQGVAFSADGGWRASGSMYQMVNVSDADGGVRTLRGHTDHVLSVVLSPDARRLASGGVDGTIKIWDASGGPTPRTCKGHVQGVRIVAFSPDGSRLTSWSVDGIKIWDVGGGQKLRTLKGHTINVMTAALSPDGSQLASGCWDGTIKLWDVVGDRDLGTLEGHTGRIHSVAYSADGSRLASASLDGTIKLWDVVDARELFTLRGHTDVFSVAFSPDGRRLASGSLDRTVKIWDVASGQELRTLKGHAQQVWSVAFSPDGRRLASGSVDQTVRIWDAASGQELRTLKGHINNVYSVAFSPDGRRLASGSVDQTVKIWDAASGQELFTLKEQSGGVFRVAFSPDGWLLASGNIDGTLKIWDAQPLTPELRRHCEAHGLVEYVCQKSPSKANVSERIRADKGITEEVRQEALSLLEDYWRRLIRAETEEFLQSLFDEGLLRDEVVARAKIDRTQREAVRQQALVVVDQHPENASKLNHRSWLIVRRPDATPTEYHLALRQAEAACRGEPKNGFYMNTLGVAQYRVRKWAEAIVTLTHSENRNTASSFGSPHPADLAFLALAHANLGHQKEAEAYRQRLQNMAKQPRWAGDPETQDFVREVEAQFREPHSRPKSRSVGGPEEPRVESALFR